MRASAADLAELHGEAIVALLMEMFVKSDRPSPVCGTRARRFRETAEPAM